MPPMQDSPHGEQGADAVDGPAIPRSTGNQPRVTASGGVRRGTKSIPAGKVQRSFYINADNFGQARAAILNAGHLHGYRNLSAVVDQLLQDWVAQQQARHNAGRPWPIEETQRPLPRGPALE